MPSGMKVERVESTSPLDVARPLAELDPSDTRSARATALVFQTLASPIRVQIIGYLQQHEPTSRAQLTLVLRQAWATMEHHLTVLVRDGFLVCQGHGSARTYMLARDLLPRIRALCAPSRS